MDISILLVRRDNIMLGGLATVGVIFTSIAFRCFLGATSGRTGYTRPRGLGKAGSCAPSIYDALKEAVNAFLSII